MTRAHIIMMQINRPILVKALVVAGALIVLYAVVRKYSAISAISEPFYTHNIPFVDSPKVIADVDQHIRAPEAPITRDSDTGRVNQPEMMAGVQPPLAPLLFVRSSPLCCPTVYTDSRGCKCGTQPAIPVDFSTKPDDGSGNGYRG